MAALLGVPIVVVQSWERRVRSPLGAAKRLVWLWDRILREKPLKGVFQVACWGKAD